MSFDGAASGFAAPDEFASDLDQRWRKPPRALGWRLKVAMLLACGALAGGVLARGRGAGPVAPPAAAASRFAFVSDGRSAPMLSFRQAEGAHARISYEARVNRAGAERWDTLTVGDVGGEETLFQVTVHLAQAVRSKSSLFVDLARQSAGLEGAVVHATNPRTSASARGPLEWADVTLSGAKGERRCRGFRLVRSPEIDLSGLACGAHGAPIDAASLGHLIDRLSPTAAGVEAGLGEVFAAEAS